MAIQPGSLSGTIVNEQGRPLAGVTVTLIGVAAPQVQVTDTQGHFSFANLAPGNYRLSAILEGHGISIFPDAVINPGQNTDIRLTLNANPPREGKFFQYLTAGQYIILGLIGGLFAYFLIYGVIGDQGGLNMVRLRDPSTARGVITYLVAVSTVAIATILVMAAIMSGGKDLDKRFALGKEVLTLLIGVLGTIIGFYYGSTSNANASTTAQPLQITDVKVTPEQPQVAAPFNISGQISGGIAPYTYGIKFDSNVIPPTENLTSSDGKIMVDLMAPKETHAEAVGFVIEVKDHNQTSVFYNQDGKQKITFKK